MQIQLNRRAVTLGTNHALQLVFLLTAGILLSACKQETKVGADAEPTGGDASAQNNTPLRHWQRSGDELRGSGEVVS